MTELVYRAQPYVGPIALLFLAVAATVAARRKRSVSSCCFAAASWLLLSNAIFLTVSSFLASRSYLTDGSIAISFPQPLHATFAALAIAGGVFAVAGSVAYIRSL